MTVTEFITNRVRRIIGDSVVSYRWDDTQLLAWVNEGREQLYAMRPEAFYVSEIVTAYPGDLVAVNTIDITESFRSVLVNYVAYRTQVEDSEDTETRTAAENSLKKFIAGI